MTGGCRDRNLGRNAVKDQQRRKQESAADAEHAGKEPNCAAHAENHQPANRHLGNGQVDFHRSSEKGGRAIRDGVSTLRAGAQAVNRRGDGSLSRGLELRSPRDRAVAA